MVSVSGKSIETEKEALDRRIREEEGAEGTVMRWSAAFSITAKKRVTRASTKCLCGPNAWGKVLDVPKPLRGRNSGLFWKIAQGCQENRHYRRTSDFGKVHSWQRLVQGVWCSHKLYHAMEHLSLRLSYLWKVIGSGKQVESKNGVSCCCMRKTALVTDKLFSANFWQEIAK